MVSSPPSPAPVLTRGRLEQILGGWNPFRGRCLERKGGRAEGNLRLPIGAVPRVEGRGRQYAFSPFVAEGTRIRS